MILVGLIKRISTTYTITNQRLHIQRGIIARHVQETRLDRVQNVNTNQGVERILQVGTVDFDTAGSGDSDFAFRRRRPTRKGQRRRGDRVEHGAGGAATARRRLAPRAGPSAPASPAASGGEPSKQACDRAAQDRWPSAATQRH